MLTVLEFSVTLFFPKSPLLPCFSTVSQKGKYRALEVDMVTGRT